ncbi:MAG: hypothetical protein OHK0053_28460 [Microscillaceae bacterium]
MANKLHELLAVEQDRKHKANQVVGEAINTFKKNDTLFDGMVKRYLALEEDSEQIPDETKEMGFTVQKKMGEVAEAVVAGLDAQLSKEETNASGEARADLEVDGVKFGNFSATSLLALEGQITKIRDLYQALPTLDPSRKWNFDSQNGHYRSEEEVKFRSVKRPKVIVKYEATEKHPAQTELLYLDFQVGKYETVYFSGKVTPAQKDLMLKRLDQLLEAVKIARSKANTAEVKNIKLGNQIFDFINRGIF